VKNFYIVIIIALPVAAALWFIEPTGWLFCSFAALVASLVMMRYALRSILRISYLKKLYDLPGGRHLHTTPTPRLGGLAFAPIVFCVTIIALTLHQFISPEHHANIPNCLMWISALIFIHMVGTVDDLVGVRYYVKFLAQIIAALLVVASGFWINDLGGLFGVNALLPWVGMPLTVLFIIGIVNAFNLIDGMDGLAAGISIIALSIYGVHCFATGRYFFSLVAFASLGTVIPFFYANTRGLGSRRRKLFMGDTGSQTLGLIMSVLAVGQLMNNGTVLASQEFILALSPLVIPVFDVAHVVFFRIVRGKHPFHPDMTHFHHRLMRCGLGPRRALVFVLLFAVAYVAINMLLIPWVNVTVILVADIAVWCALNGVMFVTARRRAEDGNEVKESEKIINTKKFEHNLNY
jgi:UDP-N-acetylmuramyl pentapeptide phosphotransferase/UDP-N-acetylglucosamine-1-phosphate transferase